MVYVVLVYVIALVIVLIAALFSWSRLVSGYELIREGGFRAVVGYAVVFVSVAFFAFALYVGWRVVGGE